MAAHAAAAQTLDCRVWPGLTVSLLSPRPWWSAERRLRLGAFTEARVGLCGGGSALTLEPSCRTALTVNLVLDPDAAVGEPC